jgi:hypothetical protein
MPGEYIATVNAAAKARGITPAAMYRKIVSRFVVNEMRSEGINPQPQEALEALTADQETQPLGEW